MKWNACVIYIFDLRNELSNLWLKKYLIRLDTWGFLYKIVVKKIKHVKKKLFYKEV